MKTAITRRSMLTHTAAAGAVAIAAAVSTAAAVTAADPTAGCSDLFVGLIRAHQAADTALFDASAAADDARQKVFDSKPPKPASLLGIDIDHYVAHRAEYEERLPKIKPGWFRRQHERMMAEGDAWVAARQANEGAHSLPALEAELERTYQAAIAAFNAIVNAPAVRIADLHAKLRLLMQLEVQDGLNDQRPTIDDAYALDVDDFGETTRLIASTWADGERLLCVLA